MNAASLPFWLALGLAYALGSLSFAIIVSRMLGEADPRSYGSGNPGATNVLRSGNRKAAALTLLLDAAKGAVAVMVARLFAVQLGFDAAALAWIGLAAFIGHLWPVFFRFQGGKGVATAAGVLLALSPWVGLATLALWLLVAFASRYSSLAALLAALGAPALYAAIEGVSPALLPVALMSALLIARHHSNIRKLLAGSESKIGSNKA